MDDPKEIKCHVKLMEQMDELVEKEARGEGSEVSGRNQKRLRTWRR